MDPIALAKADLVNAEYDNLNKEMQENAAKVYQVLGLCVPASAALLSYVFTIDPRKLPFTIYFPPFLLLIPFLILMPSMMLVQASMHSTTRIASYLEYVYERGDSPIKWQTSIQAYRKDSGRPRRRPFRWALMAVFGGLGAASLSASAVSFVYVCHQANAVHRSLPASFLLCYVSVAIFLFTLLAVALVSLWKDWGGSPFSEELSIWERLRVGPGSDVASIAEHVNG